MSCDHSNRLGSLSPPKLSQSVHREECTQCFDSQDSEAGIDVCLSCFNGGCLSDERHHARTHHVRTQHPFTLNVKRKRKPKAHRDEPPQKMTKLAILEEREEDKYEWMTQLKCWLCDPVHGSPIDGTSAKHLIDGVMQSMSSGRQSEVKAWEEELVACEHTLTLVQSPPEGYTPPTECKGCGLKENLWLCLTCGNIGCGRQQYGGVGGNSHGLKHFEETLHPVSVKLGTITPEGGADVFCYACGDERLSHDLAIQLGRLGINVATAKKTEKSMTELQIEHNLNYDFSMTDQDGKAMEPVFGKSLTGLANLGNSCYMASVLQTLFALPSFVNRFDPTRGHADVCPELLPADCVECQLLKVADGLLSGRYSVPDREQLVGDDAVKFQAGLKPGGFKALFGKGHAEFSTMRQQDAEEFFGHFVTVLRRYQHKLGSSQPDPTGVFTYATEQRLQCSSCGGVKYRTDENDVLSVPVPAQPTDAMDTGKEDAPKYKDVQLDHCIQLAMGVERIDGWKCPGCSSTAGAVKSNKFATLPSVLVVHAKKFQLVNWVPTKLDVPVILPPNETLEFTESALGKGLQATETALPEGSETQATGPQFDSGAMAMLEGMGFPLIRCQKALIATGGDKGEGTGNAEAAMEWLFAHMEDPDIDAPLPASSSSSSRQVPVSEDQIMMLADMGFTAAQAKKALQETDGNAERAVEWLFNHPDDTGFSSEPEAKAPAAGSALPGHTSVPAKYRLKAFISHKGISVHSGHYVAHIRTGEDEWVLFNDEKVVKADKESVDALKKLAYLYVFERV